VTVRFFHRDVCSVVLVASELRLESSPQTRGLYLLRRTCRPAPESALDIFEVREALPVRYRDELGFGEQLLGQRLAVDSAFLDENGRTALQN